MTENQGTTEEFDFTEEELVRMHDVRKAADALIIMAADASLRYSDGDYDTADSRVDRIAESLANADHNLLVAVAFDLANRLASFPPSLVLRGERIAEYLDDAEEAEND